MTDRIDGIIDRVSDAEKYEKASWLLGNGVLTNFAVSVIDDTIKANVDFQGKAGLPAKVKRYTVGYCCDWCQSLVGTYTYPDVPDEVWHRHQKCNCLIDYTPADGGRLDRLKGRSKGKGWELIDSEELENRKAFTGVDTAPKKIPTNDLAIKYGKDNYDKIVAAVASADGEMQTVWNKFVDDIGVVKTDHRGGAYFSPMSEGITVNVKRDIAGNDWSMPLQTTFHESGHNIDYLAGGRDKFTYYSGQYKNGALREAIIEDYNALVAEKEAVLKQAFKDGDTQTLIDNGITGGVKYYKRYAYNALANEIEQGGGMRMSSVSDITEGASKAKVQGRYGHGKAYWQRPGALEKEAFAEFTAAEYTNPEELEALKKYYPRAYKVYREMIAELAK